MQCVCSWRPVRSLKLVVRRLSGLSRRDQSIEARCGATSGRVVDRHYTAYCRRRHVGQPQPRSGAQMLAVKDAVSLARDGIELEGGFVAAHYDCLDAQGTASIQRIRSGEVFLQVGEAVAVRIGI